MKLFLFIISVLVFLTNNGHAAGEYSHASNSQNVVNQQNNLNQQTTLSGPGWSISVTTAPVDYKAFDAKLGLIVLNNVEEESNCTLALTSEGKYQLTGYNGYAGKQKTPLCWKKMITSNSDYVIILLMRNGSYHVYSKEYFNMRN